METAELENKLKELAKDINEESFIYDLLGAYDFPKATISRLRSGDLNVSKNLNEVFLKKKLCFKAIYDQDLHDVIDDLSNSLEIKRHDPRFIIVTNFEILLTLDTKSRDTLDIQIEDIYKHYDFFLPWIGREKTNLQNENIADVKAATKMSQLYDLILQDNPDYLKNDEKKHSLNIFFARLLFCLFAEDTNIFEANIFTNYLATHSNDDGSDLGQRLEDLFLKLNTKETTDHSKALESFPFVNGGLFASKILIPNFSRKSRTIIIEAGQLDWGAINPDIFGSMVQAIADPEERSDFGVHYTSVPNILKLIKPLFIDGLNEQYEKHKSEKDLENILERIYGMKIFDPACGSGNFLTVAYKELCAIEIKIFQSLQGFNKSKWSIATSGVRLNQFYGITIKGFDAEIAKLSLWLSQHQMNKSFQEVFGMSKPTLPLTEAGNILNENSTRTSWDKFCKNGVSGEIYVIGNPPYLGSKRQSEDQKQDMEFVFKGFKKFANVDYIGCWFKLAADFIAPNVQVAFVSTNSISQGTMVDDLWKPILGKNVEIGFAIKDFPWSNNAKNNAKVICVIISLRYKSNKPKYLFTESHRVLCKNINAYLMDAPSIFVERRTTPISIFPEMKQGNIPLDNGFLRFTNEEKLKIVSKHPKSEELFRRVTGSDEMLNNIMRWCLWIDDRQIDLAKSIPEILDRIIHVKQFREEGAENAKACADRPHQFCMLNTSDTQQIVIPIVSSSRRKYMPIDVVDSKFIVMNSALIVTGFELYIFGILSSAMHNIWLKTFGGKLKSDIRYSVGMCWYSFPFPIINDEKKSEISNIVNNIFNLREKYSENTLAELYGEKMPKEILNAHLELDQSIDSCYRDKSFNSDEERLQVLFDEYKKLCSMKGW